MKRITFALIVSLLAPAAFAEGIKCAASVDVDGKLTQVTLDKTETGFMASLSDHKFVVTLNADHTVDLSMAFGGGPTDFGTGARNLMFPTPDHPIVLAHTLYPSGHRTEAKVACFSL